MQYKESFTLCHRRRLGGQPRRVPPIIEKRPCFHQLIPPFFSQYFGLPNIFQIYASALCHSNTQGLRIVTSYFALVYRHIALLLLWVSNVERYNLTHYTLVRATRCLLLPLQIPTIRGVNLVI